MVDKEYFEDMEEVLLVKRICPCCKEIVEIRIIVHPLTLEPVFYVCPECGHQSCCWYPINFGNTVSEN